MADFAVYVLLIVAVAAGWGASRFMYRKRAIPSRQPSEIYHDYFVGLNYLLRDEPDEAIDTFIRALEINGDTIETHLALGTLLRRRGKVDKAIKVHQALLARPGLSASFADSARLELSTDYIAAGILDRAERLLNELLQNKTEARWDALNQLVYLYQTEKEWDNAINCVQTLLANPRYKKSTSLRSLAAHFCCELVESALSQDRIQDSRERLKRAFRFDRNSVRASFLAAEIEKRSGNLDKAIKELVRISQLNPEFVSEIIPPMAECYEKLGDQSGFEEFLLSCLQEFPRVSVILQLTQLVRERDGEAMAIRFLSDKMGSFPSFRGMSTLLTLQAGSSAGQLKNDLELLKRITENWLRSKPAYHCNHCGFKTRSLHWQCPGCQKWDTVAPILGIEGE